MSSSVSRKLHEGCKSMRQLYKFVPPHLTYVPRGLAGSHVPMRAEYVSLPGRGSESKRGTSFLCILRAELSTGSRFH
jgi:hypothetical protein